MKGITLQNFLDPIAKVWGSGNTMYPVTQNKRAKSAGTIADNTKLLENKRKKKGGLLI